MDDSTQPSPGDHLEALLEQDDPDEAVRYLERLEMAPVEDRKTAVRTLRDLAEDSPSILTPVRSALTALLEDPERSVRLTTAKLFVTLAESNPDTVVPAVPALADRLADETEFYYVRARAAEALGYVALEHPDVIGSPDILAELRVGLSFDDPEVKEKLAKALEHVALGDPERLRHQVSTLAAHLGDDEELVRYHIVSALVAVGTESPDRLTAAQDALVARLDDENEHVRGRAAEALGLLARASGDIHLPSEADQPDHTTEDTAFVSERLRFAFGSHSESDEARDVRAEIGTLDGVRETTADAVDAITTPDGECPHCGLAIPSPGPPTCPRCGAPD
jgi:HEAT repeat protein